MAKVTFKPMFNMSEVKEYINDFRTQINDHVVSVLIDLATKAANDARSHAEFINHTHNLRSSIGAVVFKDGLIVHSNFKLSGNGGDGMAKGENVSRENIPPKGIGMMLVAGEDYALYVEAKDNKWVISGSSMRLEKVLQQLV
ncbi:hypothetical protein ACFSQ3_00070 [Sphingobacterium corticis]|uniref:Uncharacterized protein n=1 Tax=Sphingobacterium corticis TaxID=1812823 RepID=A0ABW5NFL7_9SPHI